MTVTVVRRLCCDVCNAWQPLIEGESIPGARERLHKKGWRTFREHRILRDRCPASGVHYILYGGEAK